MHAQVVEIIAATAVNRLSNRAASAVMPRCGLSYAVSTAS
jgi:hypothetical protein